MSDIILATLNAKYPHSSFGLRYLLANMGDLAHQTRMLEFGISQQPIEMLDAILQHDPKIVGFGVYIWNVEQTTRLVTDLKRVRPDAVVVLGGPEVSYEIDEQQITQIADFVITGEADLAFPELCRQILAGRNPKGKVIDAETPALDQIRLPYHLYDANDIANRVIYVEASRGCPYTCEFCLSALEIPVRQFPLDEFLDAMQSLIDRGATRFKFVDRTFNLNMRVSCAILEFFLNQYEPGMFLHFEMIPDRLPDSLREPIAAFPPAALQFEVGIQTFNSQVADLISRRQDNVKVEENLHYLREQTGVHIHADLIVGLPGETIESFADGFDRLVSLRPQEIQVGMLKRLRGTPIVRHDDQWQMVYSPNAPYEILQNKLIDFETMSRMRRFARYWDLIANSGNFVETTPLIWNGTTPFEGFLSFSDWLFRDTGQKHAISLIRMTELVFEFLVNNRMLPKEQVAQQIWNDYRRGGRHDKPHFLRDFTLENHSFVATETSAPRQARHLNV